MTLRTQHEQPAVGERRQYLMIVRAGTAFALPAGLVRGLGHGAGVHDGVPPEIPIRDLLAHFTGVVPSGTPGCVVLCGRETVQEAVLVDEVLGLTDVPLEQVRPLPAQFGGSERVWFAAQFLFQNTVALLVDMEWLLVGRRSSPHALPAPDR